MTAGDLEAAEERRTEEVAAELKEKVEESKVEESVGWKKVLKRAYRSKRTKKIIRVCLKTGFRVMVENSVWKVCLGFFPLLFVVSSSSMFFVYGIATFFTFLTLFHSPLQIGRAHV